MHFVLWEPRPRGDGWWCATVIATRASLLQGIARNTGECLNFVGAPPSGRWVVVCDGYRDEGVAPTGEVPAFVDMQGNARIL